MGTKANQKVRSGSGGLGIRPGSRGFLLLVILGVLAVLLAVCVGFLSFTRAEINAVATLRDKNDGLDVMQSALDWMVANIEQDLMSGNTVDAGKHISSARGAQWWYRPYEKGLKDVFDSASNTALEWKKYPVVGGTRRPNTVDVNGLDEAAYVYLPEDFFPEGGFRGRFMVQVLDPNGFPNLNDWNDDCNPTQCQMAHMFMDGYGEQELECYREYRDGGSFTRTPKYAPVRYHEAWRVATRTVRYLHWPWGNAGDNPNYFESAGMMCSPNWYTTNSSYFSLSGAEMASLKTLIASDGIQIPHWAPNQALGPNKYYPPEPRPPAGDLGLFKDYGAIGPGLYSYDPNEPSNYGHQYVGHMPFNMPFVARAYVDPDTGRSPVNVNTCYNSGDKMPASFFGGTPCYSMEAVFNVESLRRIVNVGDFYIFPAIAVTQKMISANVATLFTDIDPTLDASILAVGSSVKIVGVGGAYDGTFTITAINPTNISYALTAPDDALNPAAPATPIGWAYPVDVRKMLRGNGDPTNVLYMPNWGPIKTILDVNTYSGVMNAMNAWNKHEALRTRLAFQYQETLVRYFTGTYNHPASRQYPPLNAPTDNSGGFAVGAANLTYTGTRFPTGVAGFRAGVFTALQAMATGSGMVNFGFTVGPPPIEDVTQNLNKGQLDARTANAVWDNILPGKPGSWPGGASGGDPLTELFNLGLGRDELRPTNAELTEMLTQAQSADKTTWADATKAKPQWNLNVHGFWNDYWDGAQLVDVGFRDWRGTLLAGAPLHLRPKGMDIGKFTAGAAPLGPYAANIPPAALPLPPWPNTNYPVPLSDAAGKITNVPYRQLCFGPDWFSTELTTSTTTFVFIINAQLVDAKSISEDPNKPRDVYWGQWGVCVEVAPDILKEDDNTPNTRYYKNGDNQPSPGYYKTQLGGGNPDSMDCVSSTVRYTNHNGTTYSNRSSVSKQWKADLRGVRPADASSFYTDTNQVKRRVVVRAIWNLNQVASR